MRIANSSSYRTMFTILVMVVVVPTLWSMSADAFQLQHPSGSRTRHVVFPSSSLSASSSSGEVGEGSNWIEKSFPVGTEEKIDIKKVEDYNLGINGRDFQTGSLSRRMFDAITSRTSLEMSDEIKQAFKLYAMDFTAKEATRAALQQNGLQMVLQEDEEDQGMWGDVEAVRVYDSDDSALSSSATIMYDSLEEAVEAGWTPGQTFDFVARQVPAKVRELSLDELVQALDPDGKLREEAKSLKGEDAAEPDEEALLSIFDDIDINSLSDLANDVVRRTQAAPRETATDETAYTGSDESRGYRVISRSDLLRDSINQDGTENEKTLAHVMHSLVAHGVILVDLTDGGTSFRHAEQMNEMWKVTEAFFDKVKDKNVESQLQGMTTVMETGSQFAKVGYATVDNGSMKFLETRRERDTGNLLPRDAVEIIGNDGIMALQSAFDLVLSVGKDVVRIAVAASSIENGSFVGKGDINNDQDQRLRASQGATLLCNELVDDGKPLPTTAKISHSEGMVSMSPHRLCSYSEERNDAKEEEAREVFGAHTDSSFVTIVPVAAVSGLEVYDEEAERWYRPELRARLHWEKEQQRLGNDPTLFHEPNVSGKELPWHSRYIAVMPGEHLQLCTQNEVPATVHRVVAAKGRPPRLSAPILLRGRPGTRLEVNRYLGSAARSALLDSVDGMTMEQIHEATQPSSYE